MKLFSRADVLESEDIERKVFEALAQAKTPLQSEPWLKLLFDAFEGDLMQFASRTLKNRELAQDLIQETFFRLYRDRASIDARAEARPRSWLWRVLRNLCMDHFRAGKKETLSSSADDAPEAVDFSDAQTQLIEQSDRRRVLNAMDQLPDDQREALQLRVFSELSYEEIAKITQRSVGSVKTLIHRAKQRLIQELGSEGDAHEAK